MGYGHARLHSLLHLTSLSLVSLTVRKIVVRPLQPFCISVVVLFGQKSNQEVPSDRLGHKVGRPLPAEARERC